MKSPSAAPGAAPDTQDNPTGPAGRPGRRRSLGALAATAFLAAGTAVAALVPLAGSAQAATGTGLGFVWASNASATGCYTPQVDYSETTGSTQDNQVCRTGTGSYRVRLSGLGTLGGVAQATAYGTGSSPRTCSVNNWYPSGGHQYVNVVCAAVPSGAPANTRFTVSYTNLRSAAPNSPAVSGTSFGYLWSQDAPSSNGCWTPTSTYQYHTRGGNARVCRDGVGSYQVHLPNQQYPVGTAQVSAYGAGERCKVVRWSTTQVQVRCFSHAGAQADSPFSLSYARKGNVLGGRLKQGVGAGHESAYAWASNPTSGAYTLSGGTPYQFNSHVSYAAHAYRSGPGAYRTTYDSGPDLGEGTVQVTGYGSGNQFCNVDSWGASGVRVACYDALGRASDSSYTVAFTGKYHTDWIEQAGAATS